MARSWAPIREYARPAGHASTVSDRSVGSERSFGVWVSRLSEFVGNAPDALPWSDVSAVEVLLGRDTNPDHPRFSVVEFEDRWQVILRTVNRGWVNLSAYGVQGGVLVVAVEWHPPSDGEDLPRTDVSVNLSGAAGPFDWPWRSLLALAQHPWSPIRDSARFGRGCPAI
jgi:hypothetical protein